MDLTLDIERRRHVLGFEAEGRRSHMQAGTRRRINYAAEIFFAWLVSEYLRLVETGAKILATGGL